MSDDMSLAEAMAYARAHATEGLKTQPGNGVYHHTLDQLAVLDQRLAQNGDLRGLARGEIDVGIMAVKALGSDEQNFAHALHSIQWFVDEVTGERKEFH